MANAPRKTTAQSRTRAKSGAAPAVAKNKNQTVESDPPTTVDTGTPAEGESLAVSPDTDMSVMERAEAEADAEDARQESQARQDAAQTEAAAQAQAADAVTAPKVAETNVATTVPADEPPKITEGVYGPAGTQEEPTPAQLHGAGEAADPAADAQVTPPLVDENDQPAPRDLEALKALADPSGLGTPYPEGGVQAPTPVPRLPVLRNTYDWTREGDVGAVGRVLVDGFRVQCNGHYRFARKGDRVIAPQDVIEQAVTRKVMAREG